MSRSQDIQKAILKAGTLIAILLSISSRVLSQMSITGPTCVTPGVQYNYTISGNWGTGTNMNWNVTGGTINGFSTGTPLPQIHVTWNSGISSGLVRCFTNNPSSMPTLTVNVAGSLQPGTLSPSTQTINYGTTPATITSSSPSGGSCTPNYTYQWQQSTDNVNFTNIPGATGISYSSGSLTSTTYFRCYTTETNSGSNGYTPVATVFVNPPLSGGTLGPATQSLFTGSTPTTIGGSPASGGSCGGSYSYQWQQSTDGVNYSNNSGTGLSYAPPANTGLVYYRRQVSCSGQIAYSTVATVDIEPHLAAGSLSPINLTILPGTSPGQITGSASSGGLCGGSYSYQWQQSSDGSNWSNIPGAAGLSYTPGNLSYTTYYQRQTTCGSETALTGSSYITVQVQLGTVTPATQQINYGANASALTLSSATGGSGVYSFQWYYSTDGTNYNLVNGATSSTYIPTGLTANTYFKVSVNSGGTYANSNAVIVNVYPQLVAGSISPGSQSINYNSAPSAMSITGTSGGNGTYTYQWYSNASGSYQPVGGATGSTYSPGALTTATNYYVAVTSNGVTVNTAVSTVTVYPPLVSGTISPATQNIAYNATASVLTVSGTSGGSGSYTYQWYSNAGGSFQPLGGATGSSYSPGSLTFTVSYEVVTTSNGASVTSAPATVTVTPQLTAGTITPAFLTISSGSSPGIISTSGATGGNCSGNPAYSWQSSPDGATWTTISGATGQTYSPGNLSSQIYYRVVITCGSETAYTAASHIALGTVAVDMNYIRTRDIQRPGITDTVTADNLSSPFDVAQTTQYYDGLGRQVQTVVKQSSPLQKDLVTLQAYDAFGRETVKYLPFISAANDGNYKPNALSEQGSFNTTQYPGEQLFYGIVQFEPSPLDRPSTNYASGNSWVGSSRGASVGYLLNTLGDSVRIWIIGSAQGSLPATSSTYGAGQLFKNRSTDESGHTVIEYVDKQGNTLLKKTQLWNTPANGHSGWLNTYYIYDDLNNLRFVIQPRGVEWLMSNSWNFSNSGGTQVASELCFRYEYDIRKRMIIKKFPGAGESWMVYDSYDRLVMTQDSVLRKQQKWMFTRYDALNRADSTGLITDPSNYNNLAYHLNLAASSTIYPNLALYTSEVLTKTFFDNYAGITSASGLPATMATNYTTNGSYFITSYNTGPVYALQITSHPITRGLVTGSATKIVGTASQFLYAQNFFDDRGRTIQIKGINYTGGIDTLTTQYSFSGKPLRALSGISKPTNSAQVHLVLTKTNYDHQSRITSITKRIDGTPDQLIDSMVYNELGQLRVKYLGNNLDSLVYDYNIRGWTTGINKNYIAGTTTHYFGMELGYDKAASASGTTYTNPIFNGNIAGTIWKSAGDGVNRKYDYTYDNLNRLMSANYLDNKSGAWNTSMMDYSVSNLSYDANGNILSMNQKGFKIGSPGALIDQLLYFYQFNGSSYTNKLSQVSDAVNDPASQLGDFHYTGTKQPTDYSYDGNGSLTVDNNKNIDNIVYNFLGLPQLVHMNGKGNIVYTYDASGNKMQKQTIDSTVGTATTTLYLNGFQYQRRAPMATPNNGTDTLQFLQHEEGRARWAFLKHLAGDSLYAWVYDFAERDHLGNMRVLLTQEKDTAKYLASMEGQFRNTENQLFYNIPTTSYARNLVSGYPTDLTVTNPNDSVARVNGSGPKSGPAIILKVMSGDKVDLAVQYYYNSMTNNNGPSLSATDLLYSLASGVVSLSGTSHGTFAALDNSGTSPLLGALNSSIGNQTGTGTTKPQAYLNWVLLDNQFTYQSSGNQSGALQVGSAGTQANGQLQPALGMTGINITKSGYLYIYVSNATPGWDVFFDNLSVRTYSGPMLEEDHYYPFGLTMAGISDKAIKTQYPPDKYRYSGKELQNQEFSDGSGLEEYDFGARMLDPQLGVWHAVDPLSEKNRRWSPYNYAYDDPQLFRDPDGMSALYDCMTCGAPIEGNTPDDDGEKKVTFIRVRDGQGNETNIIIGYAAPGAKEEYHETKNSGAGDPKTKVDQIKAAFNDGKKVQVYSFKLWVQQPRAGSRHTKWTPENNVGHTFITLTKTNEDGSSVSQTFGYYPTGNILLGGNPFQPQASGSTFQNDEGHPWTESITKYVISETEFNNVLTVAKVFESISYNLETFNCTTFGVVASYVAGVKIEDFNGSWPTTQYHTGTGANPASLGNSLIEGKYINLDRNNTRQGIDFNRNPHLYQGIRNF